MTRSVILVIVGFLLGLGAATAYALRTDPEPPLAELPAGPVPDSAGTDSVVGPSSVPPVPPFPDTAASALPSFVLEEGEAPPADTAGGLDGEHDPAAGRERVARILAAMKAPEAARIIEQLDDAEAQLLLAGLSERKVAMILGHLSPQRAAAISRRALHDGRSSY